MKFKKGLVNILTPAYNCAEYISRLLDSILLQTYPHVEMFVIDDGSTDNTKEVVKSYISTFEKRGYKLHYDYQDNAGQNAAINRALKWVTGEYLLYPDSDDWYKTSDAIAVMVNTLAQHSNEVEIARCQYEKVDADSMAVIGGTTFYPCGVPCNLLEDAFYGTGGFAYAPIEFILRTRNIDKYIKNREIFVNKLIGQNYQILIPYLANSQCVTIDEILCCYLVRHNSHSHSPQDYSKAIAHKRAINDCMEYTLSKIDILDDVYKGQLHRNKRMALLNECLSLDCEYSKTKEFRKHFLEAKQQHLTIDKKYYKLWIWTFMFNIKSYKMISKIMKLLYKYVRKQ